MPGNPTALERGHLVYLGSGGRPAPSLLLKGAGPGLEVVFSIIVQGPEARHPKEHANGNDLALPRVPESPQSVPTPESSLSPPDFVFKGPRGHISGVAGPTACVASSGLCWQ